MESLFNVNGLMFWNEREVRLRRRFEEHFASELQDILLAENPAWRFIQFEGPQLTPRDIINPNYTNDDIWVQESDVSDEINFIKDQIDRNTCNDHRESDVQDALEIENEKLNKRLLVLENTTEELVLRPETTPSSYVYAQHLLNTHSGVKPPFVVWQTGKSFRREQDQVTKNMRLKEFYQQEFQCIYTTETMNDYQEAVLEPVRKMIGEMVGLPTRIVESDRLPSYSLRTMDVECWCQDPKIDGGIEILEPFDVPSFPSGAAGIPSHAPLRNGRWMELCSISKRTDFPQKARFATKKGIVEKDLEVLEVAIGLDRCVYNFEQKEI